MARDVWQKTVTDDTGNIVSGAQVTVNIQGGGLATIYSSQSGGSPMPNPFLTGSDGVARFYAEPDFYSVSIVKDSDTVAFPWNNLGDNNVRENPVFVGNVTIDEYIVHSGDTNTFFGFPAADTFTVTTNATERMRIDASGNVGIGTSSPSSDSGTGTTLQIAQNANNPELRLTRTGSFAGDFSLQVGGDNTSRLRFIDNASDNTTMTMLGANVGIGTTSPSAKLSVFSGVATQFGQTNINQLDGIELEGSISNASTASLYFSGQGSGGAALSFGRSANSDTGITFSTAPIGAASGVIAERMRIDASGNVGIGTTTPQARCDFDGGVNQKVGNFNRNGTDGVAISFEKNGTTVGSIAVTGSLTSYNTSSDYRLKNDIQPVSAPIDRVKLLNPVNFEWIADETRVDGFIAHELADVIPEAVTGDKDEVDENEEPVYQGIDQSKIVPLLTAALQEAIIKIEDLGSRVAALEGP